MSSADFALAQRRVLERRRLRETAERARHAQNQNALSSGPLAKLGRMPYPLDRLSHTGIEVWNAIKGREGTRPAFRVGQVDAELLDEDLLQLLKGQVGEGLRGFGAHLKDEWSAEIMLALRAILFKLTIWDHNASYGAALQGLRYTDARAKGSTRPPPKTWQKSLYGIITVGGRYAWDKWEDWLADREGGYVEATINVRLASRLTSILDTTHSITAFVSFLVFLYNGRYRTLLDRILRLRLAPTTSQVSHELSFEYLNRQLVWHAFTEFLLFLLPLVGISRWRKLLARSWRKVKAFFKRGDEEDEGLKAGGELGFLPERTCAICYQDQNPTSTSEQDILAGSSGGVVGSAQTDITNPYETIPCGCKYCFVCLAQKLEAEEGEGWTCLRCGELVKKCKPWNGDVLEETSRPGTGKSVGFVDDGEDSQSLVNLEPIPVTDIEDNAIAEAEAVKHGLLDESSNWSNIDRSPDTDAQESDAATPVSDEDEI